MNQNLARRIRLWPGDAPGAVGNQDKDIPDITVYLPEHGQPCAAVVVCPGGAYRMLCTEYEGTRIARWLNQLQIAAIVLKYRLLPDYKQPCPLLDVQRAIRFTRAQATEWGVDTRRVGVMGFSAGGHLAGLVSTHADDGNPAAEDKVERMSCRPNFTVMVYPFLNCRDLAHEDMRQMNPGNMSVEEACHYFTPFENIDQRTPPAFLIHSTSDGLVSVEHSRLYAAAMKEQGRPVELVEVPEGGHGFGGQDNPAWQVFWSRCGAWLRTNA